MQINNYKVYKLKLQYRTFINYSYIFVDIKSRQAMLVDPAWNINYIVQALENMHLKLCGVLLTHSHFDHTNLAAPLANRYNVDVYMAKQEIEFYKFNCINLKPLQDEELIYVGETAIKCMLTPGHTAGSACYYADGCLFTGDSIFIEGCGICTPGGTAEDMFWSIKKIKKTIPATTKIYPGHCYGKELGCELGYLLENNIYFQVEHMDKFVAFRMRKGQSGIFNFK